MGAEDGIHVTGGSNLEVRDSILRNNANRGVYVETTGTNVRLLNSQFMENAVTGIEIRGSQITIGTEHGTAALSELTIITATYAAEEVEGVLGVIGPTRMPYEKILAVVECTSSLVSSLLTH